MCVPNKNDNILEQINIFGIRIVCKKKIDIIIDIEPKSSFCCTKPATHGTHIRVSLGRNETLFKVGWSYGEKSGKTLF